MQKTQCFDQSFRGGYTVFDYSVDYALVHAAARESIRLAAVYVEKCRMYLVASYAVQNGSTSIGTNCESMAESWSPTTLDETSDEGINFSFFPISVNSQRVCDRMSFCFSVVSPI